MKRDSETLERRNNDIYARFNQLLPTGKKYQIIYEQIGYEFYLSDERVKKIVLEKASCAIKNLRKSMGHSDPKIYYFCRTFAASNKNRTSSGDN